MSIVAEHKCGSCGEPVNPEYGTMICPRCHVKKCVEFCIPSGVGTICNECEEAEESDD